MSIPDEIIKKIMTDLKVELSEEFDKNFERKAFFAQKTWVGRKSGQRGSLLMVTGRLRRSLRGRVQGKAVVFTSDAPYAAIHNEGGTIKVTAKMKRYFWAKYYELSGKVKVNVRTRSVSKTTQKYSAESEYYKSLALMKVGSSITIPERRFIGDAPEVRQAVKRVMDNNIKDIDAYLKSILKQKK
jgi:phage gpG-like protein